MQRNVAIVIGVFVVACILMLLVLWVWWTLLAPAAVPPPPTSAALFVTPTQSLDGEPPGDASPTLPPTIMAVTLTPSSTPAPTFTPSATPVPTPTPIVATSTPRPISTPVTPYAAMNSPHGFVNIRNGPGVEYDPPLGTYQNDVVADVLGKQYSSAGDLWWLISFPPGPFGRGWVYAPYTDAQNVGQVPWVTAPATPTPVTPSATPRPHAIINSPDGFLNVRSGPGAVYQPPLGRLNNGTMVDIVGKQMATNGALWWLVPFSGGWNGRGWIFANYTIARNTDNVPWVAAPPTPTLVPPTLTPTPTPTQPSGPPIVNWIITGRVINATTGQPVGQASVQARLGNDGTILSTLTDSNGYFSLVGQARDDGNLTLTVNAFGYEEYTRIAGAIKPRVYDFPNIGLVPQQAPVVPWIVTGRVIEIGTYQPVANAEVSAVLGDDGVEIGGLSAADGQFSLDGQARDSGTLSLTIVADGYQTFTASYPPNASRIYNLADLSLVPLANSCAYESVINLSEATALARLQSLSFTNVATTSIVVNEGSNLIGRVVTQSPDPPPEGQSVRVNCQIAVTLNIGVPETAN